MKNSKDAIEAGSFDTQWHKEDLINNTQSSLWQAMSYAAIAGDYSSFWKKSNQTQLLGYNKLTELLGDLQNKKILDYGCGTWEFTNILHQKWANIIGVDLSANMIQVAQQNDSGWDYRVVESEADLKDIQDVDAVLINYVFCTFDTKEKIQKTLHSLYKLVKSWWKIYIQNGNREEANWLDFISFWLEKKENLQEGDEIYAILKWVGWMNDLRVKDFFYSQKTYMELLMQAGFIDIRAYEMQELQTSLISPVYIIEGSRP